MSGYNDTAKLRDALELARSFGNLKDKGRKNSGGGGGGGGKFNHSPRSLPPYSPRFTPALHNYERVEYRQREERDYYNGRPNPTPINVPLPSKRNYAGLTSFQGPRQDAGGKRAIGSVGLEFLRRQDKKTVEVSAQDGEVEKSFVNLTVSNPPSKVQPGNTTPVTNASAMRGPSFSRTDFPTALSDSSSESETAYSGTTKQQLVTSNCSIIQHMEYDKKETPGNILDTFFSLVASDPNIGQEIEAIANRLATAMDLDAPSKDESKAMDRQEIGSTEEVNFTANGNKSDNRVALDRESSSRDNLPIATRAAGLSTTDIKRLRPDAATFNPQFDSGFFDRIRELNIAKTVNTNLATPAAGNKENGALANRVVKPPNGLASSRWAQRK